MPDCGGGFQVLHLFPAGQNPFPVVRARKQPNTRKSRENLAPLESEMKNPAKRRQVRIQSRNLDLCRLTICNEGRDVLRFDFIQTQARYRNAPYRVRAGS